MSSVSDVNMNKLFNALINEPVNFASCAKECNLTEKDLIEIFNRQLGSRLVEQFPARKDRIFNLRGLSGFNGLINVYFQIIQQRNTQINECMNKLTLPLRMNSEDFDRLQVELKDSIEGLKLNQAVFEALNAQLKAIF